MNETLPVRRRTVPGLITLALLTLGLGACATTAQECDPRKVSNVFTALSCEASGGFEAYLVAAREEVETERRRLVAAQANASAAQRESARQLSQRDVLNRHLAAERANLDRTRLRVSQLRVTTDRERARVTALREQLAQAERNLASMSKSGATPEEIARLEAENAAIREAIGVVGNRALQE